MPQSTTPPSSLVLQQRKLLTAHDLEQRSLQSKKLILLKKKILEGRPDLLATEILKFELKSFHMDILRLCMNLYRNASEGLLLAPRGFGKSTIGTVAFGIWLFLRNPDIRILIGSSTAGKAEGFLREIKGHIENNGDFIEMFGNLKPEEEAGWRTTDITIATRTRVLKDATVTARGLSGAVVGSHFDFHILDDLVNEDNARTKGQREKLQDFYYNSLDPTRQPHAGRLNTGTRYHYADLYGHLIEVAETDQREVEEDEDAVETDEEPLKVLRLKAIQDDGTSLWPEKWPLRKLERKKRRMGSVRFGAQYQNETELMKGKIFKERDFMWYRRSELDVARLHIYQGVDLSVGEKDTDDFFALVTKGYDPITNNAYTLDAVQGHYTFREQMIMVLWKAGKTRDEIAQILGVQNYSLQDILSLFDGQDKTSRTQWPNVIRIGIESVAFQKVLPNEIIERTRDVPVIKIESKGLDKLTRMQKYSPRFENHMEYLPEDNSCDNLKEEMLLFEGKEGDGNDDLVDAHEICNQVASVFDGFGEDDEEVEAKVF